MKLTHELLKYFSPEERHYIRTLNENGQLLVTDDENAMLPSGVSHILLTSVIPPKLIRKRFMR